MNLEKRLSQLEQNQASDPELDFSDFSDEELEEMQRLIEKLGEDEDYSLLTDQELDRVIELCKKAENECKKTTLEAGSSYTR